MLPSFEISEKYEQMTVIELPHKAPTIRSDLAITQYEVSPSIISSLATHFDCRWATCSS